MPEKTLKEEEENRTIPIKTIKDMLRERSEAFLWLSQYCSLVPLNLNESHLRDWGIFLDSALREIERLEEKNSALEERVKELEGKLETVKDKYRNLYIASEFRAGRIVLPSEVFDDE